MRYVIKQKALALSDMFRIFDDQQQPVYQIKGKILTMGEKLSFQDMEGHELAHINQKLLSFKPKYEIFRGDSHFAWVIKEFSLLNSKFTLDVPGDDDYKIEGNFWEYEYVFTRSGEVVATVSKKLLALADAYDVDVAEGEDSIAILATVIVVDMICHHAHK